MERLLIIATCSVSVARPDLVDITNLTGAPTAAQIQYSSPLLEHVLERVRQRSGIKDWGSNGLNLEYTTAVSSGSFSIALLNTTKTVRIVAADSRGMDAAIGRLARELRVSIGAVKLPLDLRIAETAHSSAWLMRGHQYTAAHHDSMFRTWDEFDVFTKDNVVFGTNQIELAHFSKPGQQIDVASLVEYSRRLDQDGVNVSFWWSLDLFTTNKSAVETAWREMPRIDSVFFPGGDGGTLVWPDIESAAEILHTHHPSATVWVSAQEFSDAQLTSFFKTIDTPAVRAYLHGVVVGPHWSIPTTEIVKRMPKGYPLRQYPDICHPRGAQYQIRGWHWGWQSTHGRQTINPQPLQHAAIVRLRANGSTPTIGVGAYSEGLNDDLNKAIWSGLAETPSLSVNELVQQYARYHFGADAEDAMVEALFGLEQNWVGDIGTNAHVLSTLAALQQAEALATKSGEISKNWRLQMYLYRGYYDAFVQWRFRAEQACEERAYAALATARDPSVGSYAAIKSALQELGNSTSATNGTVAGKWRDRLTSLWTMINKTVGVEVVQSQETDLNIGSIDRDLNDRGFLRTLLANISSSKKSENESTRLAHIDALLSWTDPGPGGYYDDLGDVDRSPHVDRGDAALDPDYYASPYTTAASSKDLMQTNRLAWQRKALVFYDATLRLVYPNLDPRAEYVLDIVYAGKPPPGGSDLEATAPGRNRLMANDELLHDYVAPPVVMTKQSFPISRTTTAGGGTLVVKCDQPPGLGGTGRTCEIAEVWLRVVSSKAKELTANLL